MKILSKLIVAGCLLCSAPLALACDAQHRTECFQEMDKNGDGVISKKEFNAFHDARFKEMDANHDGKLSQDELEGSQGKRMGKGMTMLDQQFDAADTNHDGALSKVEAEQMPMLSNSFDAVDANKDGKVSKEELQNSMQIMHGQMGDKCDMKKMKRAQ